MNDIFSRGMAAATRLTQAGKLAEATSLIQRALSGRMPEGNTEPAAKSAIESPLIEGTVVKTRQGPYLRTVPHGPPPASRPMDLRAREDRSMPGDEGGAPGRFVGGRFTNSAGTRAYKLYTPTARDGGLRPLIVMLHGCTQSADDFAAGTRMNVCAEEHECFVVYPEQSPSANASKCWNWFQTSDQRRDHGEPAIIAGLTRDVMNRHPIDPNRVFIAGLSAGGAAAAVLSDAYPDLYSAVGVHSGLACGAAGDMASAFMAMQGQNARTVTRPERSSSFVPTIVFHGDRDSTVHPRNGAEVVARATELSEFQVMTENGTASGCSYSRCVHRDRTGRSVIEEWIIHGAGHAWSGGSKRGSFADPRGPDASREMLRFFLDLSR
jgi:poly(hydroxyalkanoate) depolymerase family esterase